MVIDRCELPRRRAGLTADPCRKLAASLKQVRSDWNDSLSAAWDEPECDPLEGERTTEPELSISPCPPQLQYSVERRLRYIFEPDRDVDDVAAKGGVAKDREVADPYGIALSAQKDAVRRNGRGLPWMSWEELESCSTGPAHMASVRRQLRQGLAGEPLALQEARAPASRPLRLIDQRLAAEEERLLSAAVAARSAVRTETAAERRACQQVQRAELQAQAEWPCSLLERHAEGFVAREPKLQAALDRAEERLFTEEDTLQRLMQRHCADEDAWLQERDLLRRELQELSLRSPPEGAVSALRARLEAEREDWKAELREAGVRGPPQQAFRDGVDLRDLRLEAEVAERDAERAQCLAQLANEDVAERRRESAETHLLEPAPALERAVRRRSPTEDSDGGSFGEASFAVSEAPGRPVTVSSAVSEAETPLEAPVASLPFPALVRAALEEAEADGESSTVIRKSTRSRSGQLKDLWSQHREKLLSGT